MKKILILTGKINKGHEYLAKFIGEQSNTTKVSLKEIREINFLVEGNNIQVFIGKENIKDFDLVFFRRIGDANIYLAGSLIVYLNSINKPFIDKGLGVTAIRGDKLTNYIRLAVADLPIIKSVYYYLHDIDSNKDKIVEDLGFPIIAKDIHQHYSKGIYVIKKTGDFNSLIDLNSKEMGKSFLLQKFVNIEAEYRIIVLGGEAISAQKMVRDLSGTRAKIDFERKEEYVKLNSIPNEALEITAKAAKALDIQVAGVDIAKDTAGNWWLLEVNRGPALTYDTNISPEVIEISKYINSQLKNPPY